MSCRLTLVTVLILSLSISGVAGCDMPTEPESVCPAGSVEITRRADSGGTRTRCRRIVS